MFRLAMKRWNCSAKPSEKEKKNMSVSFIDLAAQQNQIKTKIDQRIQDVLAHGKYILGPEVIELEKKLSEFSNVKNTVTCANGTDALLLALMALDAQKGDAIFCPTFTFAATAEVVPCLGATPVFVDSHERTFNMDTNSLKQAIIDANAMGLSPKGIIVVDLFGLPADYDAIETIAKENDLWIIADSAQSYGAEYKGRVTGAIGDIATTSFFPAKPLGCYGDGGAIFTDNEELAALMTSYRFHGKGSHKYDNERIGMNSRLDTIQAGILLEKLEIYKTEIESRNQIAQRYIEGLADGVVKSPHVPAGLKSVWAQFTVIAETEDARATLMANLKENGIPSVVYYPMPLHRQTAYKEFPISGNGLPVAESLSKRVFSLPMHPYLDENTQDKIIEAINTTKI